MEDKTAQSPVETTSSMIAQEIREGIAAGRYKSGEKIKETDLCRQFGVSRTPVREAFRLLQNEGLLIYIPQCGVQVPKFEVDAAMNTQQVRVVMECLSARNAAAHISNQEILKLKDINEQIRSFDLSRPTRTNGLDREFHIVIARSGNNPYVAELLPGILNRYQLSSYLIPFQKERIPHTYKEHSDIITALEMRDPDLAELYMKIHFRYSTLSIEKKIQKYVEENQGKKKRKRP